MIPKHAFCIWFFPGDSELPFFSYLSMKSFMLHHPGHPLTLLTNAYPSGAAWEELSPHISLEFVNTDGLQAKDEFQGESCLQRIRKLKREGGIYFDVDIFFFDSIPAYLYDEQLVMPKQPDSEILNNGFIMADPDSSELHALHEAAERRAKKNTFWCSAIHEPHRPEYANVRVLKDSEMIHRRPNNSIYKDFLFSESIDPGSAFAMHWWNRFIREKRLLATGELPFPGTAFAKYAEKIKQAKL